MTIRSIPVAVLALLLPGAAPAQGLVDLSLVMERNADRVVTETAGGRTTRTLDMGDGVTILCEDGGCIATDAGGANGCMFRLVTELTAIARLCPAEVGDEAAAALSSLYEDGGALIAPHAVPPLDWAEAGPRFLDNAINAYRGGPECPVLAGPQSEVMAMIRSFTGEGEAALREMLARPRLPVMNPCL